MEPEYFELPEELVDPGSLCLPKVRELIKLLRSGALPHVKLVAASKSTTEESVLVDIESDIPTSPVHDIQLVERIMIVFNEADKSHPLVLAMRKTFPTDLPHLYFLAPALPRSLCLYETKYKDVKHRWTAAGFLQQLYRWLSLSARGELHHPDQPLERFFYDSPTRIILPSFLFEEIVVDPDTTLVIRKRGSTTNPLVFIGTKGNPVNEEVGWNACIYTTQPLIHGILTEPPQTVAALHTLLIAGGNDFETFLRQKLLGMQEQNPGCADNKLLIVVRIPRLREIGEQVENIEVWAFGSFGTIQELGAQLGIWQVSDGHLARLLPPDLKLKGEDSKLLMLNPVRSLTRDDAAFFNNTSSSELRYVAIGVGSIGSQVVNNMVRAGQGKWTLIDDDIYLPHNAARHYLPARWIGSGKSTSMKQMLDDLFEGCDVVPVTADVLQPDSGSTLGQTYKEADILLDMSASVAVARHLALDVKSAGRRISLFLSPAGTDLVLLAEPYDRHIRLDMLEMDYYRALIRSDALKEHLRVEGQSIRYSHACRDVSIQLPQEQVALHAAIGARGIRLAVNNAMDATIKIWRADAELSVVRVDLDPQPYVECTTGEWKVIVSSPTLAALSSQRGQKLPNETGGVLIGTFDTQRSLVYVIDHIPSPTDSKEWPTAYYRGIEGLMDELKRIAECTGQQIGYVGEWHSHPDGCETKPSGDDRILFKWLQEEQRLDGLPAVMAIVGSHKKVSWYVDDVEFGQAHYSPSTL